MSSYSSEAEGPHWKHSEMLARLAVHEALQNLFPFWKKGELHVNGGGGLALKNPQLPMTERNKEMLRRGLSVKNPQLL